MTILDQSKTLAESALQMLYAAKEGGGNPKVRIVSVSFDFFFKKVRTFFFFFLLLMVVHFTFYSILHTVV